MSAELESIARGLVSEGGNDEVLRGKKTRLYFTNDKGQPRCLDIPPSHSLFSTLGWGGSPKTLTSSVQKDSTKRDFGHHLIKSSHFTDG